MTIVCTHTAAPAEVMIKPSLDLNISYDSNPFLRSVREDVEEDYVLTAAPQLAFRREGRIHELYGSYRADGIFYTHEPVFNYLAHTAGLGVRVDTSARTTVVADDKLTFNKDSLVAFGVGIQTVRTDIISNMATLSIDHELNPGSTVALTFSNTLHRFEDETMVDTRTDSAKIELSRATRPGRIISGSYRYTNYIFARYGSSTNADTHSLQLSMDTEFGRDTKLNLSGGVIYSPDPSNDFDVSATVRLTRSFRDSEVSVGYVRSVTSAYGLVREISESDEGFVSFKHDFTSALSLNLAGNLTHATSKPSESLDLTSYTASLSFDWKISEWISTSLAYTRFVQWVEGGTAGDLKRDRVGLTLIFTPEQWRI